MTDTPSGSGLPPSPLDKLTEGPPPISWNPEQSPEPDSPEEAPGIQWRTVAVVAVVAFLMLAVFSFVSLKDKNSAPDEIVTSEQSAAPKDTQEVTTTTVVSTTVTTPVSPQAAMTEWIVENDDSVIGMIYVDITMASISRDLVKLDLHCTRMSTAVEEVKGFDPVPDEDTEAKLQEALTAFGTTSVLCKNTVYTLDAAIAQSYTEKLKEAMGFYTEYMEMQTAILEGDKG